MGQTAADGMRGVGLSDNQTATKNCSVVGCSLAGGCPAPPPPSRRPLASVAYVGSGWLVCKINF